jgi:tRNA/tmRNA/rRNA uracil-C5-methylase (TrmA/RlmC/RlmD family)
VLALVPPGPVVDLYAGVGLFGLSVAATGAADITLVEGDPVSGADLEGNAAPFSDRVYVRRTSVEEWLRALARPDVATFIVDPPRTGMSREALTGIIAQKPERVVYVSCDVATLARDVRTFLDAGFELGPLTGFDLFPNTAHVETVAVLDRG